MRSQRCRQQTMASASILVRTTQSPVPQATDRVVVARAPENCKPAATRVEHREGGSSGRLTCHSSLAAWIRACFSEQAAPQPSQGSLLREPPQGSPLILPPHLASSELSSIRPSRCTCARGPGSEALPCAQWEQREPTTDAQTCTDAWLLGWAKWRRLGRVPARPLWESGRQNKAQQGQQRSSMRFPRAPPASCAPACACKHPAAPPRSAPAAARDGLGGGSPTRAVLPLPSWNGAGPAQHG